MPVKSTITVIAAVIIFQILISVTGAHQYLLLHNTLAENGRWIPTKSTLKEYFVGGGKNYYFGRQALAKCRLHLEAWNGYQEVLFKDKVNAESVAFDFLLARNAYFYFIFNKDAEKFSCIRFSLNEDFQNSYISALNSGKFLNETRFDPPGIRKNAWNRCEIVFEGDGFAVYVNGKPAASYKTDIAEEQFFGFRGSEKRALIDNVTVKDHKSNLIIKEDFFCRTKLPMVVTVIFFAIFLFNFFLFFIFGVRKKFPQKAFLKILFVNILLFVFSSLLYYIDYHYIMERYPTGDGLLYKLVNKYRNIDNGPRPTLPYGMPEVQGEDPRREGKEVYSIIFAGASQLKGAGAFKEEDIISEVVERRLNEISAPATLFECVNFSFPRATVETLLKKYGEWETLSPGMVIISIPDINDFEIDNYLHELCMKNDKRGIKTVFFWGARSNAVMTKKQEKALAGKFGKGRNIHVFGYSRYLWGKRTSGMLWWDHDHLTSYGQELAGTYIFDRIKYLIQSTSSQHLLVFQPETQ